MVGVAVLRSCTSISNSHTGQAGSECGGDGNGHPGIYADVGRPTFVAQPRVVSSSYPAADFFPAGLAGERYGHSYDRFTLYPIKRDFRMCPT